MKFAHFTTPEGRVTRVIAEHVQDIRDALPGEHAPGAKTVIIMESGFVVVREAPDDVEKTLAAL